MNEDKGKKKAPSKSKSQYGDIFHLYQSQDDETENGRSVTEQSKKHKTASNTSKRIHSPSVHPSTEEGTLMLSFEILRITRHIRPLISEY